MYFLGLILVGLEVLLTVWLVLLVITGNWGGIGGLIAYYISPYVFWCRFELQFYFFRYF